MWISDGRTVVSGTSKDGFAVKNTAERKFPFGKTPGQLITGENVPAGNFHRHRCRGRTPEARPWRILRTACVFTRITRHPLRSHTPGDEFYTGVPRFLRSFFLPIIRRWIHTRNEQNKPCISPVRVRHRRRPGHEYFCWPIEALKLYFSTVHNHNTFYYFCLILICSFSTCWWHFFCSSFFFFFFKR